jgi:hypothetical protein
LKGKVTKTTFRYSKTTAFAFIDPLLLSIFAANLRYEKFASVVDYAFNLSRVCAAEI